MLRLSRHALVAVFGFTLMLTAGCSDADPTEPRSVAPESELDESLALQLLSEPSQVISSLPELCGETTSVPLLFGGTYPTGMVQVGNDETSFYVTVRSNRGRSLLATALYVGDSPGDIPLNRLGAPSLRSFPYTSGHPFRTTEVIWQIPMSHVTGPDAVIAAFAQAGVFPSWGAGEPIEPRYDWATWFAVPVAHCGSTTVGPEGGPVTSSDGRAAIEIPAGALSSPTAITIDPATIDDLRDYVANRASPAAIQAAASAEAAQMSAWGASTAPARSVGLEGTGPQLSLHLTVPEIEGLAVIPNTIWDFGPDGTQFDLPATVTLSYDPADLPAGVTEAELGVFVINGVIPFLPLPSIVDPVARTVTAQVEHFSFFFVGYETIKFADLSVTDLAESADTIELGQSVEYVATVQNLGPDDVSEAVAWYVGFGDLTVGPPSAGCTEITPPLVGQAELRCEVGPIGSGGSTTAPAGAFIPGSTGQFTVWSSPGSEATDPNGANDRYEESFTVIDPVADLMIDNIFDNPDPAAEGENIVYTVELSADPATKQPVEGSTLLLNPGGDATFVSATDEACFGTALGVSCPLPTLLPGVIYAVDVTLAPNERVTTLAVVATVQAPFGTTDPDLTNNQAIENTTIGSAGSADLAVSEVNESADPIELGESVTYTATVRNFGANAVTDAIVVYQMFGNAVAGTLNSVCFENSSPVVADVEIVCPVGALAEQGISLAPWASFTPQEAGEFTVWVNVGSSATDPVTSNNRYEGSVTVIAPEADLVLQTLFDNPDPAAFGEDVTYSVQVALAPSALQAVEGAQLYLNPGGDASFVSASDAACFGTLLGATCPLPTLSPGVVHAVDVVMSPNGGVTSLTVVATVEAPFGVTDPDPSNNFRAETTTVEAPPSVIEVGQVLEVQGPRFVSGQPPDTVWFDFSVSSANEYRRVHLSRLTPVNGFGQLVVFQGDEEIYPILSRGRTDLTRSANDVLFFSGVGDYRMGIAGSEGTYRLGLGTGQGRLDPTFGTRGDGSIYGPIVRFVDMDLLGDETLTLDWATLRKYDENGVLSTTFGTSGEVSLAAVVGGGGGAVRVQPDGRIVVAAQKNVSPYPWLVARFNGDGSLDPTFGINGIAEVSPGGTRSDALPLGIRFQQNGSDLDIVVAGRAGDLQNRIGIVRLNPDGSLDTGFGTNGVVFDNRGMTPAGMDIQSDGRIFVQGTTRIVRYTADGVLDTSFGTGGQWDLPLASTIQGFDVLPDRDILVMGELSEDAWLMRLTPDGAPDGSFGSGGLATYHFGLRERFYAATQDPSGRLVVVGRQVTPGDFHDRLVVRMSGAGVLDPDFGHGGYILQFDTDTALAARFDTQGRLVVGGEATDSTGNRIFLTRHIPD